MNQRRKEERRIRPRPRIPVQGFNARTGFGKSPFLSLFPPVRPKPFRRGEGPLVPRLGEANVSMKGVLLFRPKENLQ